MKLNALMMKVKTLMMKVNALMINADKAVSVFHNKNQKKIAWEAVAKDIGLETGQTAKNASTSLICETKEDLERLTKVWNRCRKSNESKKGRAGVSFSQLAGQF